MALLYTFRVTVSPETCRVKPLRRIKTQLLHLVGLISLHWVNFYTAPFCTICCYCMSLRHSQHCHSKHHTYHILKFLFKLIHSCVTDFIMRMIHSLWQKFEPHMWRGRNVMRLATLCTNWQCCCLPLHMAVRLTPAVDSVQIWTCYVAKRL